MTIQQQVISQTYKDRINSFGVEKKIAKKKVSVSERFFEKNRDDLEAELFTLFSNQDDWSLSMNEMMECTGMSRSQLKKLLKTIAVFSAKGTTFNRWVLMNEYMWPRDD